MSKKGHSEEQIATAAADEQAKKAQAVFERSLAELRNLPSCSHGRSGAGHDER